MEDALAALVVGARAPDLESEHLDFKEPLQDIKATLKVLADAAV